MQSIPRPRRRRPLADRLWANVAQRGPDDCWLWTGPVSSGYGRIRICNGNPDRIGAHVAAYVITWGPVPAGLDICHLCDTPLCCNPHHLVAATALQNVHDARAKGRLTPSVYAHRRGAACTNARLTEDQVRAIRALAADGVSRRVLGLQFGVSNVTITHIVHRRAWAHVA